MGKLSSCINKPYGEHLPMASIFHLIVCKFEALFCLNSTVVSVFKQLHRLKAIIDHVGKPGVTKGMDGIRRFVPIILICCDRNRFEHQGFYVSVVRGG